MPSWKLHRKIYEKLSQEVEGFVVWTEGLLDKIDKIIDAGGEHDLGRRPDPLSFRRLLYELWLEFGDVHDIRSNRFLGLKSRDKRSEWMNEAIRNGTLDYFNIYIPDDAIALATLHHMLDLCMECLRKYPIAREEAYLMVVYAEEKLRDYFRRVKELETLTGESFKKIFKWLIEVLKGRSVQLYRLMVEELKKKGLKPGYSPEYLASLLTEYIKKKGYYGVIYVNGTLLPIAAAAYRIFSDLRTGRRVEFGFSRYRGPYPPIHEKIEVSNLEELFKKLSDYKADDELP